MKDIILTMYMYIKLSQVTINVVTLLYRTYINHRNTVGICPTDQVDPSPITLFGVLLSSSCQCVWSHESVVLCGEHLNPCWPDNSVGLGVSAGSSRRLWLC